MNNRAKFIADLERIIQENKDELEYMKGKGKLDDVGQQVYNDIKEMLDLDVKIHNFLIPLTDEEWEEKDGFTLAGDKYGRKRDAIVSEFRNQLRAS